MWTVDLNLYLARKVKLDVNLDLDLDIPLGHNSVAVMH